MSKMEIQKPLAYLPPDHPLIQDGVSFKVGFSADTINDFIDQLAARINQDYQGIQHPLVVLGVLKGCLPFMADLLKKLKIPVEVEFVRLASYHGELKSSGQVKMLKDISSDLTGRHVLIAEEIVDSGRTLLWLKNRLSRIATKSVRIACLFDKRCQRVVELEPDYIGSVVENLFLVGYGLDLDEYARNMDHVVLLEKNPS